MTINTKNIILEPQNNSISMDIFSFSQNKLMLAAIYVKKCKNSIHNEPFLKTLP